MYQKIFRSFKIWWWWWFASAASAIQLALFVLQRLRVLVYKQVNASSAQRLFLLYWVMLKHRGKQTRAVAETTWLAIMRSRFQRKREGWLLNLPFFYRCSVTKDLLRQLRPCSKLRSLPPQLRMSRRRRSSPRFTRCVTPCSARPVDTRTTEEFSICASCCLSCQRDVSFWKICSNTAS